MSNPVSTARAYASRVVDSAIAIGHNALGHALDLVHDLVSDARALVRTVIAGK